MLGVGEGNSLSFASFFILFRFFLKLKFKDALLYKVTTAAVEQSQSNTKVIDTDGSGWYARLVGNSQTSSIARLKHYSARVVPFIRARLELD